MSYQVEEIAKRLEVEDVVTRLFVATDQRDWGVVEACFTDPLTLDMTSMVGGSPTQMQPSELTAAWAAGFASLDHVHHQVGNYQTTVTGDSAHVHCYGIAFHYRGQIADPVKTRTFVGTYDFDLTRSGAEWRIELMTFNLKFIDGNLELEKAD